MGAQLKRATSIAAILSEEGLGFIAARLGLGGQNVDMTAEQRRELPVRVRRTCERLGPFFVKFGQILSGRRDLIPDEFCEELAKLQANVMPFANKEAMQIITTELGKPISEVFARIDDVPMAAASLAQVYGAELKDGRKVVLKVRRPNAFDQVTSDVELLLWLSRQLHRLIPQYRAQQMHRVAEEFAHEARKELDFLNETNAAIRFGKHLKDDSVIRIPEIYRELSTSALIVMERFSGTRLDQVQSVTELEALGMSGDVLVETLIRTLAEQAFLHGLIHADLHPGNIFILPEGRIGLIDFGMHGEFPPELQGSMTRIMSHRANGRNSEAVDALLDTYIHDEHSDVEGFRREMMVLCKELDSSTLKEYSIAKALTDEGRTAAKYRLVAPSGVLMFGRAMVMTEGIAMKFLPNLRFTAKLQPIMQRIIMKRFDLSRLMESVQALLPEVAQHLENLPKVARQLMAINRRMASGKAQNLSELLGFEKAVSRPTSGAGPWLLACILWVAATAAAIMPVAASIPLIGGVSWFAVVLLAAATALTGLLVSKRL